MRAAVDNLADGEIAVILGVVQQRRGLIVEHERAGAGHRRCGLVEVDVHPLSVVAVLHLLGDHILLRFDVETASHVDKEDVARSRVGQP